MNEQYWEPVECKPKEQCGTCPLSEQKICYHYAEFEGDAEVLRITAEAQKNVTELGYWRDVATGLSLLVNKLRAEVGLLRRLLHNESRRE